MSYPINYPTPQGADVQIFTGPGSTENVNPKLTFFDWVKPQGASFVMMVLVGAGGGGAGAGETGATASGGGGGSGAVTSWLGPAFLIPDVLRVAVGGGGNGSAGNSSATGANGGIDGAPTSIIYQQKDGTGYTLLTANGGGGGSGTSLNGGTGGSASTSNFFGAVGFFQSIGGQSGGDAGSTSLIDLAYPNNLFVSGGAGGSTSTTVRGRQIDSLPFEYPIITGGAGTTGGNGSDGFFVMQPAILSVGGAGGGGRSSGGNAGNGGRGGMGSGGGGGGVVNASANSGGSGGRGGDGMCVIISW